MEVTLTIINRSGVHARPAAMMAQTGRRFKSKITYTSRGRTVDGKNIVPITSLGLTCGKEVTITAVGEDEREAIAALTELIENRFGERD